MDRERLVDETLMLLPTLIRLVERPSPVEMRSHAAGWRRTFRSRRGTFKF